ncbi:hypothetical protein CDD83_8538 [Cordyceps sp. RAO-2017]|nr:hypothetical protein CDD83_8538 [Cordyceps sp. RAO-2017]
MSVLGRCAAGRLAFDGRSGVAVDRASPLGRRRMYVGTSPKPARPNKTQDRDAGASFPTRARGEKTESQPTMRSAATAASTLSTRGLSSAREDRRNGRAQSAGRASGMYMLRSEKPSRQCSVAPRMDPKYWLYAVRPPARPLVLPPPAPFFSLPPPLLSPFLSSRCHKLAPVPGSWFT